MRPELGMGEPTRPNSCLDDTQMPGNQALCVDAGDDEGECLIGPTDHYCSLETSRSCLDDAECNPPPFPGSSCSDCLPGQTCELRKRACFTDNGIIGGTVTASGSVETLCDGVSRVTAAALYCVPPGRLANGTFGTGYVDAVLGLPGLARSESAERMVLQP